MEIGDRIKFLRERAGMSQEELAHRLGYKSRSSINKIELNKTDLSQSKLKEFADALNTTPEYLLGIEKPRKKVKRIPIYGEIAAGIAIDAVEDIIGYEFVDADDYNDGEYMALRIKGDSMEPKISNGDIVIIRRQPCVDSGQIAAVMINGETATVKKVVIYESGISLVSTNPAYEPMFFTRKEVLELPVTIIGRVVELRSRF